MREPGARGSESGTVEAHDANGGTTDVIASTFVATGATREAVARERDRIRTFLGFLYSTPQYHATLELHGWDDVGKRLHALSRSGDWDAMNAAISDEMFDVLVPSGTYDEIASTLHDRYAGSIGGLTLRMPDDPADDTRLARVIARLA
jgi:hypothetical protein